MHVRTMVNAIFTLLIIFLEENLEICPSVSDDDLECQFPEDTKFVIVLDNVEEFSPVSLHFAPKEDVFYFNRPFRHSIWCVRCPVNLSCVIGV